MIAAAVLVVPQVALAPALGAQVLVERARVVERLPPLAPADVEPDARMVLRFETEDRPVVPPDRGRHGRDCAEDARSQAQVQRDEAAQRRSADRSRGRAVLRVDHWLDLVE